MSILASTLYIFLCIPPVTSRFISKQFFRGTSLDIGITGVQTRRVCYLLKQCLCCCLYVQETFTYSCKMPAGVLAFGAATAGLRKLRRPAHQIVHSVKYIPYSGEPASLVDCIVVDCTHPDAQTFTHHKNDNNPKVQPADCSTGIVLNALGVSSPSPELQIALEKPNVSVNHFDADALIAMWCLINREAARRHDKRALCC